MTAEEPQVREMRPDDLGWVTAQHREHFPTNVMGRMGTPFLRQYYRTFVDAPLAVAAVAEVEGRPAGFLVGVLETGAHRRRLLRRHGVALALATLVGLVAHPRLAVGLLRRRVTVALAARRRRAQDTRRTASSSTTSATATTGRRVAVLSHVAVDDRWRGNGAATALVEHFVDGAATKADVASLATLDGNRGAGPFWERQGWDRVATRRTFDGRTIRLYDLPLTEEARR